MFVLVTLFVDASYLVPKFGKYYEYANWSEKYVFYY